MIYLFYNPLLFLILNYAHYVKIFYLIVLLVYLLVNVCVFLYILSNLFVIPAKFLWSNFSSIFFSFKHNLLRLFSITSMLLFSNDFLVILIILHIQKKKINFCYLHKVANNFECFSVIKITHRFFYFSIFNKIAFKLDLIELFHSSLE